MTTFRNVLIHQLGCIAASALMSLLSTPSLAADTCPQWALQGELVFVHSNGTVAKLSNLEQTGSQFNGAGHYYHANQANAGGPFGSAAIKHRDVDGRVVGTAVGNSFEATVYWGSSSIGVYTGQIGPQGLLVGRTYDKTDPTEAAGFQSDKPLACLSREQSAPSHGATPAKPASATGPVQSDAPTPAPTSVCDAAHAAQARNSPAAPGLERQCKALTEAVKLTPRVIEPAPGSVHRPQTAMAIHPAAKVNVTSAVASPLQKKADAVSLNRQPLPPGGTPAVLPTQAPSALR